jgi:hypothetical protein
MLTLFLFFSPIYKKQLNSHNYGTQKTNAR